MSQKTRYKSISWKQPVMENHSVATSIIDQNNNFNFNQEFEAFQ